MLYCKDSCRTKATTRRKLARLVREASAKLVDLAGGPRVLISRDGRAYRKAVEAAVWEAKVKPIGGRLAVTLLVRCPDRRVRDLDNLCKGVLDSLAHAGVYADDGQIDQITIRRVHPKKGGELLCRIEPYTEAP